MKPTTQLWADVLESRGGKSIQLDENDKKKIVKLFSMKISMLNTLALKKLETGVKMGELKINIDNLWTDKVEQ